MRLDTQTLQRQKPIHRLRMLIRHLPRQQLLPLHILLVDPMATHHILVPDGEEPRALEVDEAREAAVLDHDIREREIAVRERVGGSAGHLPAQQR